MATVTISLPETTAQKLDKETRLKGYATRSEFIRSLLRQYFSGEFNLEPFAPKPLEEIKLELAKTGKYSQEFIESVIKGLSKSSVYGN